MNQVHDPAFEANLRLDTTQSVTYIREWNGLTTGQKLYLPFKRLMDIILSVIALIVLAPVFAVVAIAIKIDSPGTVFYQRKCIGKDLKPFNVHKFRTMRADSDNWQELLTEDELIEYQREFKIKNDPRVTRFGAFLRRCSIDELPQLYNILKGELSFIGPRPLATEEAHMYGSERKLVLSIKPGLTGYWQVNGRSSISYEQRIEMQLFYVLNFSPFLDILILFKTIGVVLRQTGI